MCSFFALAMAAGRVMGDGDYKDLHRRSAPRLTLHHRASTALSQGSQRRTTVSLCRSGRGVGRCWAVRYMKAKVYSFSMNPVPFLVQLRCDYELA
jgi:hypothetical protein